MMTAIEPWPPRTGGIFESAWVLDEVKAPLGTLLWQTCRDVVLWARTPPGARRKLFAPRAHAARLRELDAAGAGPALDDALRRMAAVVAKPLGTRAADVARACLQARRWAAERDLRRTAVTLAAAEATVLPADARAAYDVAVLARRLADFAGAEDWLCHALDRARSSADWGTYAHALVLANQWSTGPRRFRVREPAPVPQPARRAIEEVLMRYQAARRSMPVLEISQARIDELEAFNEAATAIAEADQGAEIEEVKTVFGIFRCRR